MISWIRWRWETGGCYGPWTRYHAVEKGSMALCGAYAPGGEVHPNPPVAQRCKTCMRAFESRQLRWYRVAMVDEPDIAQFYLAESASKARYKAVQDTSWPFSWFSVRLATPEEVAEHEPA